MLGGQPVLEPISSAPRKTWRVGAIGPNWRPPPGEDELSPLPGTLCVHREGLAFEADEAVDAATGRLIAAVVPLDAIDDVKPLSPNTWFYSTRLGSAWIPRWQRGWRSPGFTVLVSTGNGWCFESRFGAYRADFIRRTCMGELTK